MKQMNEKEIDWKQTEEEYLPNLLYLIGEISKEKWESLLVIIEGHVRARISMKLPSYKSQILKEIGEKIADLKFRTLIVPPQYDVTSYAFGSADMVSEIEHLLNEINK